MAESTSNYIPLPSDTSPVTEIISHLFCSSSPVDLVIVRKVFTTIDGNFVVQDVNGNIIFKVKGAFMSHHNRRLLLDSAGNPILTLRRKRTSFHKRWEAFRGESKERRDFLFSDKRSSMFLPKTKLDVFLENNISENVCDFKVKGSWFDRSCAIYAVDGQSSTVVARMHKKYSAKSVLLGKDNSRVTVYPNVDYAFIVAIIIILDEINKSSESSSGGKL